MNNESIAMSTGEEDSLIMSSSKTGPKTKYKGWWPEIEDMFAKRLMISWLFDPKTGVSCVEGLYVQCMLCQMAKGKGDAIFSLRTPFNQFYYNQHVNSPTHQQNQTRNEYHEKKIKEGDMKRKMQTGIANFFQPKKKAAVEVTVNSAEEVTVSFSIGTTVQLSSFADPSVQLGSSADPTVQPGSSADIAECSDVEGCSPVRYILYMNHSHSVGIE